MAFTSKAKNKLFSYMEEKGKLPKMAEGGPVKGTDYASADSSKNSDYANAGPMQKAAMDSIARAFGGKPQKKAMGGMIHGESEDEEDGEVMHHDSSGEPHTDELMEEEHPMEFMSDGGMAGQYAYTNYGPVPQMGEHEPLMDEGGGGDHANYGHAHAGDEIDPGIGPRRKYAHGGRVGMMQKGEHHPAQHMQAFAAAVKGRRR